MRKEPWFDTAIATLADPQNLRVWSVIVSLFGDLAQKPGDELSGGALTRIIEPMGIKPEAIRVALHRLRKDGWLDSTRSGRVSSHHLTAFGRAQSAQVTPRIYARTPHVAPQWHLLIAEDGPGIHTLDDLLLTASYTSLGRNTALGEGPVPSDVDDLLAFEVTARAVPDWVKARLCPPELVAACADLHTSISDLLRSRPPGWHGTQHQVATLRTLIIHRWRRVVLRHPDLPPVFFPQDWCGPELRQNVFDLLDKLPSPDLSALNEKS
ncbi:PaaX family transcriptional regulator C-terminal domain-containing protein [Lutimaribacter marinistellae]|uniref:PaaX family transcriptional regulator C-terminal domain-containing protein n=1 Tax=Lutimaribacter marinistellae TaxID=1820329 RepID=A0ABV7TGI5_9RHOB